MRPKSQNKKSPYHCVLISKLKKKWVNKLTKTLKTKTSKQPKSDWNKQLPYNKS